MSDATPSEHHIVGIPTYLAVFVALLALTAATVWMALVDLGPYGWLHTPLALLIAGVKALLVLLIFMHVRYSARLTWVFVTAGVLWLILLVGVTVADYIGRNWEEIPGGWRAATAVEQARDRA